MIRSLHAHWPEYLMEMVELAIFLLLAALYAALFEYPASPLHRAIPEPFLRRFCLGLAMGFTAIALVFSPIGKRSGAHMNPCVTLTFLRLGKVAPWDAVFYIIAQFIGAAAGILIAGFIIKEPIADPSVHYIVTMPGPAGVGVAFLAEFAISFMLMLTILLVSNSRNLSRWTGICSGCLIAIYVTFEAPLSGMSMNPARSFGSAAVASQWAAYWIYCTAPVMAMLLAAEIYLLMNRRVYCAKLHHHNNSRCIFNCNFEQLLQMNPKDNPKHSCEPSAFSHPQSLSPNHKKNRAFVRNFPSPRLISNPKTLL